MRKFAIAAAISVLSASVWLGAAPSASAWPSFATAYDQARDSAGKIVCANCHLGAAPTEVEFPNSVMPGDVFEVKVKVPYDAKVQEVGGGDGKPVGIQVGAYVQLPPGFRLAEEKELNEEQKKLLESQPVGLLYDGTNPKHPKQDNILTVGPLPGDTVKDQEIVIPVKAPDPNAKDAKIKFGKYSIYVGGNRGRGQVYSNGVSSNNVVYTSPAAGTISKVETGIKFKANLQFGGGSEPVETEYENGVRVTVQGDNGKSAVIEIPPGPKLLDTTKVGAKVKAGQELTNNPNVGGYGAEEKDIVLQDSQRVVWVLVTLALAFVCQLLLVLKKKQVERVQEYEAQQQGL
ncbi:MAG: apocytochrome f [Anaerolineae bacterium]|nr:apocytochrome f [Gloeobacterales cyanobacterium ES-bin-313]